MDSQEDKRQQEEVREEHQKEDEDADEEEEEVPPPKEEQQEGDKAASSSPPTVLNIPKVNAPSTTTMTAEQDDEEERPQQGGAAAAAAAAGEDGCSVLGDSEDGRTGKLTLSILIQEGLIEPGKGLLTIDYLGQTFKGDLLPVGRIQSQETGLVFNNPSAWAIYCKKIVNPAKKSGCGWASVKYKGRKMDHFKTLWTKLRTKREAEKESTGEDGNSAGEASTTASAAAAPDNQPAVLKHSQLGLKPPPTSLPVPVPIPVAMVGGVAVALQDGQIQALQQQQQQQQQQQSTPDLDSPIEPETFGSQGRLQPFTLSASSSALLVADVHAHTSKDPVCGYLAGQWDLNEHNLAISHAFPCLVDPECGGVTGVGKKEEKDGEEDEEKRSDAAARAEYAIYNEIYGRHLTLVGWYKSCPGHPRALPTLKDSESQLDFQIKMLGVSDASYTPCVGLSVRPFANLHNESDLCFYWTAPPPEASPQEYGRPMKMQYSVMQDTCLSQEVLDQIDGVVRFYRQSEKSPVQFKDDFNSDTKLITKMGRSLLPKFPGDQDERLWRHIRRGVLGEEEDSRLSDPLISQAALGGGGRAERNKAIHPIPLSASNGFGLPVGGGSSVNGFDASAAEDEEEIDDDEDGALMRRGGRRGSRTVSTHSSNGPPHSMATTDEVISLLLQRQAPVAPLAHSQQPRAAAAVEDDEAPLDFSSSSAAN